MSQTTFGPHPLPVWTVPSRFPDPSHTNSVRVLDRWSDGVLDVVDRGRTMIVGYVRTSTIDQQAGFEAQLRDLETAGAERVYKEQTSSVGQRAALAEALAFCRAGDTFTITKIDRLARSVTHLWEIVRQLEEKEVALRILNLGLDTSTPTGRLMLTVMGGVAEFERSMMLERQREGIAKAKSEGRYKGRKPTARAKAAEVAALSSKGMSLQAIANELGIGKASVHRILSMPFEFHLAPLARRLDTDAIS